MTLAETFPLEELRAAVGKREIRIVKHGLLGIHDISKGAGRSLYGMALNVWNRIVTKKLLAVEPLAISEYVDAQDPKLYRRIEKKIKKRSF